MQPESSAERSLADWLRHQEQLHPRTIELGLDRVKRVARRLGLLDTPPCTVIIGGTNGKGSTTTLLAQIYREAGYGVGAYTSPHLYRYNERVAINGLPVADAALCRAFEAIEQARAGDSLTYFEFGTLAALWLFQEAQVQVQVLEVGLGGRLDAVNLLDADAALVTNIGLDHQDWLGAGRDAIGREKAGIFRAGRPAVLAERQPPQGLLDAAAEAGVALQRFDQNHYGYTCDGALWRWHGEQLRSPLLPLPALQGMHQLDNAAGAIALVQALQSQLPTPWAAVQRALQALRLPGRLQWQGRFLLDVAHNAEAATALAEAVRQQWPGQRLLWLAGVLSDKPIEAIATALQPVLSGIVTCDLDGPRGLCATELAKRLAGAGLPVEAGGAPAVALAQAMRLAAPDQRILICGSFHTVAAFAGLLPHD